MLEKISFSGFALCFALMLHINLAAADTIKSWHQLTPIQQEALKPLAAQWNLLPKKLQVNLLHAANRYREFTPEQKLRFKSRLVKWSKLTPEQRERARNNYMIISKAPEKRDQLKRRMREKETGKSIASSVPSTTPAQ